MGPGLRQRREEFARRAAECPAAPATPRAEFFFTGDPVEGSQGIEIEFVTSQIRGEAGIGASQAGSAGGVSGGGTSAGAVVEVAAVEAATVSGVAARERRFHGCMRTT